MTDYKTISRDLVEMLGLKYEPVGVTLYREGEPLPAGFTFAGENFKSYCQALVLAGEGRTLLLSKEQMGYKLGTAVLGFEKEKEFEEYVDDGVLEKYGVGLFASEEASAATIRRAAYLEKGRTRAVLVAPGRCWSRPWRHSPSPPRWWSSPPTASRSCGCSTR